MISHWFYSNVDVIERVYLSRGLGCVCMSQLPRWFTTFGECHVCVLQLPCWGDYYSEDQYAVSIKKIRRIRACTHQRPQKIKDQYAVSRGLNTPYSKICNQYDILEDIKHGPYSNKSPIRRDLDNSTSNVLIPLDSWTSGLLVYKLPLSEAWLKSSNKVNQCISEQIPTQKRKILGIDQLTEDTSSSGPKDPVFVKSSTDNSEVSINGSNKPKLSETEDSTMSNHDTGKVPSNESQRNTTDHSTVVSDSSAVDYDSVDESSVCSTPLSPLEKLTGAEPISGPKTIKSILKSKSTFKAETLKGIIINEPSSALARGNKSSSVFKTNSAPTGKLKDVKIEDDPPLAIVMKELNELKLHISKNKSSYFRNNNSQQVPSNALQNKYKTQFKMNCELCGQNNHLSENCYEVLFCKKCKRTNHRTCDHETLNISQRTVKHVVAMFIPHLITMTLSSSGKEKLFKLKKLSLSKQTRLNHQML
ncbi:hypothetical protein Tco_0885688 [Tanacetum coccineum]